MALADAFLDSLRAVLGPEFVRSDAPSLDAYGVDALGKGARPDLVVIPGNTAEIVAHRAALPRAARAAGRPRRRHRLHGRRGADQRRCRALDGAAEPHPRDRRDQPARRRRAERHHRRPAARGRAGRALLSARPGQPRASRRSAATSPSAPAARGRSSTARPSATCWRSRRCCRRARSSTPARRR